MHSTPEALLAEPIFQETTVITRGSPGGHLERPAALAHGNRLAASCEAT